MMKARLIRIGNSRGVRLPKPLIEEAGLQEEVEVQVRGNALVISSSNRPRAGWAEAARQLRERGEDRLLDEPTRTRFDEQEWRWR
jgi:antitoxin MazE